MTENKLVPFGTAVTAMEEGKRVARIGWNGIGLFVFKQVPAEIGFNIIPKMQSLPETVKNEFIRRDTPSIRYENQMCIVYPNSVLYTYCPSVSDALAQDWVILDEEAEKQPIEGDRPIGGVTFGDAITFLKKGFRVLRKGWNGKGMYLYYVPAAKYGSLTPAALAQFGDITPYREYLSLKTAQGDVAVWSPSVSDVLAQDWIIEP